VSPQIGLHVSVVVFVMEVWSRSDECAAGVSTAGQCHE